MLSGKTCLHFIGAVVVTTTTAVTKNTDTKYCELSMIFLLILLSQMTKTMNTSSIASPIPITVNNDEIASMLTMMFQQVTPRHGQVDPTTLFECLFILDKESERTI